MEIGKKVQNSLNFYNRTNLGTASSKKKENNFGDLLKQMDNLVTKDEKNDLSNNNENNSENLKSGNVYGGQTTDRGTRIIQPGEDMDKNAFLRILAAQMSNQDPTEPQDGTEYVSQFAQFAAMEQMSNLNTTMSQFASQSLIGKGVMLNNYDSNGNMITGIVRSVSQSGSKILIGVEYINEKGESVIGEFENKNITNVIDVQDNRLDYINNNTAMLVGYGMIDKNVEFLVKSEDKTDGDSTTPKYENMKGIVKGVVVEDYIIKIKVKVDGSDEIKTVTMDKIVKVDGKDYINNF